MLLFSEMWNQPVHLIHLFRINLRFYGIWWIYSAKNEKCGMVCMRISSAKIAAVSQGIHWKLNVYIFKYPKSVLFENDASYEKSAEGTFSIKLSVDPKTNKLSHFSSFFKCICAKVFGMLDAVMWKITCQYPTLFLRYWENK